MPYSWIVIYRIFPTGIHSWLQRKHLTLCSKLRLDFFISQSPQRIYSSMCLILLLVGVVRFELTALCSQSIRAANCATPRYTYAAIQ